MPRKLTTLVLICFIYSSGYSQIGHFFTYTINPFKHKSEVKEKFELCSTKTSDNNHYPKQVSLKSTDFNLDQPNVPFWGSKEDLEFTSPLFYKKIQICKTGDQKILSKNQSIRSPQNNFR